MPIHMVEWMKTSTKTTQDAPQDAAEETAEEKRDSAMSHPRQTCWRRRTQLGQLVASATPICRRWYTTKSPWQKPNCSQDVKRGAIGGGAFAAAGTVLLFSLPMLSFALAYGIRTWSHWNLAICFLLSFAANVLVSAVLALIGMVFAKKARTG